jgi:hypothetical protein
MERYQLINCAVAGWIIFGSLLDNSGISSWIAAVCRDMGSCVTHHLYY